MKFNDAWEKAFEQTPKSQRPRGPEVPKILAFLWSMIAISKNVLDDIAYIGDNNRIVSAPLPKKADTEQTSSDTTVPTVKKRGRKAKTVEEIINVEEKPEEPTTPEE
jgi:hypothetical protein